MVFVRQTAVFHEAVVIRHEIGDFLQRQKGKLTPGQLGNCGKMAPSGDRQI
jgi:hypothetical protein